MKRREFYTRELQRFWRGYCGRRDIWNAKEYARSRRPVVLRRLHAIDATRVHEVGAILRPFGPNRDAAQARLLKLHTNQVIGFQACYRGYKIRLVDPAGCLPAIRRLRAQLKKYRETWLLRRFKPLVGVYARAGKALVMSQIKLRNERDERVAAAIIQSILRALHARHEVIRLRLRRERLAALA